MKRRRGRIRRWIGVLSFLVLVGLALYVLVVPPLLERLIVDAARDMGFDVAAVEVRHVSLRRAHLANLQLGSRQRLGADAVQVAYSPFNLLLGRVRTIDLIGAHWAVRVNEDGIDLGLPARQAATADGPRVPSLPFDRLHIRSGRLVIDDGSTIAVFTVDGEVVGEHPGEISLTATTVSGVGRPIELSASIAESSPTPSLELFVKVDIEEVGETGSLGTGVAAQNLTLQWTATLPGVGRRGGTTYSTLELHAGTLSRGSLRAHDIDLDLHVERDDGGDIRLQPDWPSQISIAELRLDDTRLGPLAMVVAPLGDEPLVDAQVAAPGLTNLAVGISSQGPVSLWSADTEAVAGQVALTARCSLSGDSPLQIDAEIAVSQGAVKHGSWKLALADVSVTQAFRAQGRPGEESLALEGIGLFEIGAVTLGDEVLPGFRGNTALEGRRLDLAATWPVLDDATLEADGWLALQPDGPGGELHVHCPPTALESGDVPPFIGEMLGDYHVAATVGLDAGAVIRDGAIQPTATIKLADGVVTGASGQTIVEGISGALALSSFNPPATPPDADGPQRFRAERVHLGSFEATDVEVAARLHGGRELHVEQVSWAMGDLGSFEATSFSVDLDDPVVETQVFGHAMQLGTWLPLLTDNRAQGEGVLYARVPLTIRPRDAERPLDLGQGFVYAEPGAGWIQVADAAKLETLLEQSDPRFATDEDMQLVKQRLIDALADFEYDALRVDLLHQEGDLLCRVRTQGRGRRGPDPQEIGGLTINVSGVDDLLYDVVWLKSILDKELP